MSGYAPERPRTVLKPDPPLLRRDTTDGDMLWANPAARTLLWGFICFWFYFALLGLYRGNVLPGPLLYGGAVLLPPLFFAGIVPPRGKPFIDNYLKGLFVTAALLPLLYAMVWLGQFSHFRRYYAAALGWG